MTGAARRQRGQAIATGSIRWIAVAVDAPPHREWRVPRDARHVLNVAVAPCAGHASVHVHVVLEIHVAGNSVDALPADRDAGAPTLAHECELRAIRPDLTVASHADFGRRNAGVRRRLGVGMAVQTVDLVVACVMTMIESDGLHDRPVLIACVVRAYVDHWSEDHGGHDEEERDDRECVDRIRPPREQSRHASVRAATDAPRTVLAFRAGTAAIRATTSQRAAVPAALMRSSVANRT